MNLIISDVSCQIAQQSSWRSNRRIWLHMECDTEIAALLHLEPATSKVTLRYRDGKSLATLDNSHPCPSNASCACDMKFEHSPNLCIIRYAGVLLLMQKINCVSKKSALLQTMCIGTPPSVSQPINASRAALNAHVPSRFTLDLHSCTSCCEQGANAQDCRIRMNRRRPCSAQNNWYHD